MKILISIVAACAAIASAAFAHEGHDHATGVVKERMIAMTSMGQSLLAISKRLRANKELDKIAADAHAIHELAGKLAKQFPPGSTQFPTAAKPAIWQDWAAFEGHAKKTRSRGRKVNERESQRWHSAPGAIQDCRPSLRWLSRDVPYTEVAR